MNPIPNEEFASQYAPPPVSYEPPPATDHMPTPVSYEAPPVSSYAPPAVPSSTQIFKQIHAAVGQVFVGQEEVLHQVLAALLAGGHVLLEGKPGLGKTHLVLALSRTFGGTFRRIQFTPDLMPSDVCGHTLFDMATSTFRVRRGPVFANLLLADEINRAPAKTQSSLLEVMQETQVTIDGESHPLMPPFMTFATQNPIEQEGTYPLPEAQLDRFLLKVLIDYPDAVNETWVVKAVSSRAAGGGLSAGMVQQVCMPEQILAAQEEAAAVKAVEQVVDYAVSIVRATRQHSAISLGAGTRGAISLVRVAKSYALLEGRNYITPGDVKRAVLPVLRHRVQLAPEVSISGQSVDDMLLGLLKTVEAPRI